MCEMMGKKPDMFYDTLKDFICEQTDDEMLANTLERYCQ